MSSRDSQEQVERELSGRGDDWIDPESPIPYVDSYFIFDVFEQLFSRGDFTQVDEILALLNPDWLSTPALVSVLAACAWPPAGTLKNHQAYYDRAWESLRSRTGTERTEKILVGLKRPK